MHLTFMGRLEWISPIFTASKVKVNIYPDDTKWLLVVKKKLPFCRFKCECFCWLLNVCEIFLIMISILIFFLQSFSFQNQQRLIKEYECKNSCGFTNELAYGTDGLLINGNNWLEYSKKQQRKDFSTKRNCIVHGWGSTQCSSQMILFYGDSDVIKYRVSCNCSTERSC